MGGLRVRANTDFYVLPYAELIVGLYHCGVCDINDFALQGGGGVDFRTASPNVRIRVHSTSDMSSTPALSMPYDFGGRRLTVEQVAAPAKSRYSDRSARIGEIDAARLRGNERRDECADGRARRRPPPSAIGSQNETPVQLRGDQPSGADRQRHAEQQPDAHPREGAAQHELHHVARSAPSAIRMPISLVRCATVYAVTP